MSRGEPGIFAEQRIPELRSMKEGEQDKISSRILEIIARPSKVGCVKSGSVRTRGASVKNVQ